MTLNAPPYPVADSPHTDIELRELYARVSRIERLLGIVVAPSGATQLPSFNVSRAILVQMGNTTLSYDEGWFNGLPRPGSPGRRITHDDDVDAPGVVLTLAGYVLETFPQENRDLTVSDRFPTQTIGQFKDFWGSVDRDKVNAGGWVGSPLVIIEVHSRPPSAILDWRNIGRIQFQSVHNAVVAGFVSGVVPATAGDGSVAGTSGKLHFLMTYSEGSFKAAPVPVGLIGEHVLLSELGVKAA